VKFVDRGEVGGRKPVRFLAGGAQGGGDFAGKSADAVMLLDCAFYAGLLKECCRGEPTGS